MPNRKATSARYYRHRKDDISVLRFPARLFDLAYKLASMGELDPALIKVDALDPRHKTIKREVEAMLERMASEGRAMILVSRTPFLDISKTED